MTSEDRHVAKRGGPHGDTCTRCGERVDADIHVVNPTLHDAPTWYVTVRAPQGGPIYTHTSDGGDIASLLRNVADGLDLTDADAVLITCERDDRVAALPVSDKMVTCALDIAEETGLCTAPQLIRTLDIGVRTKYMTAIRQSMVRVLHAALEART